MQQLHDRRGRSSHSVRSAVPSWMGSVALTIAVGIAYFLAARLSLALLTEPDGVAVFWPAAGIASGAVIALGFRVWLPVTVAVMVATVTANILGDRNLPGALVFALCNAGEALLIGWLIERNSGPRFSLDSVQHVLSLFLAVGIGTAASGIGGTAGFALFHSSGAPLLTTWFNWFGSDALGVIAVAPLLIGLGGLRRDPPKRWELARGTSTLAALAAVIVAAIVSPAHWYTILPLGLLLPILLAAHCRPAFAAAAALILGFAVVWTATFGIGGWDLTVHLADRVHGARATLLAISICTLVLAALFAERRHKEAALKDSTDRLQLALDGAGLGVWSIDAKSGRFDSDAQDRKIHSYSFEAPPQTVAEARPFIHPDDLPALDAAFAGSKSDGTRCNVEYRLAPACGSTAFRETRWVAVAGTVVRDPAGEPVRWLGVTRDITKEKRAEEKLRDSERALRELLGALPAATYVTDACGHITYYNAAAVQLWGVRPELGRTKFCGSAKLHWPDGTPMAHEECAMALALRLKKPIRGAEAIAERPDGTRAPVISFATPLFDASGMMTSAVNMLVDISERKHAEEKLQYGERQLRELLEALPAAVYVTDAGGRITYCNQRAIELWGMEPRLGEERWSELCSFYHSDGTPMALADCPTQIALHRGHSVRNVEAILERHDGTRIPIMPCPTPVYDSTGALTGVINMTVDITHRKNAERKLDERNTQLALAGKVALVGSFTFDLNSGDMQVSSGYAAIHGLADGTEVTKRVDWRARVHPDDLPRLDAHFQHAVTGREREHFCEYRMFRPDGELRYIESRSSISYDEGGNAEHVIGTNIDVTARKTAQTQLAESAGRLIAALDAGQVIAFEWDAVTRQTRHSDNAASILGYDANDVGGWQRSKFLARVHPDDREGFKRCLRELCPSNPSYVLSFRFCSPHRGHVWLEETAKGEFDAAGQLLRVKGLTRDITERKEAENALAERTLQLALAGKAAGVGSYAYDFDSDTVQISEGYAALHGLSERTAEFGRGEWQARVHPEDLARTEGQLSQALRERRSEYGLEYRIVRSGQVRWIESRSFISYNSNGRPQRVVGVNIDVTERKLAEDHQRALIAELDHRVKNVLATISAVAAHTLETSSSMDHFVAALDGRIRSMGSTHELLSGGRWHGVSLAALLRRELAPYATRNNTDIKGPDVLLRPEAGQTIASVLHELTTNAAKYGALSTRDGRVSVLWHWSLNGRARDRLIMEWHETGGPVVEGRRKPGYGTSVVADLVPYELNGVVDLAFLPEGVRCRIEIPARWIGTGRRPNVRRAGAENVEVPEVRPS